MSLSKQVGPLCGLCFGSTIVGGLIGLNLAKEIPDFLPQHAAFSLGFVGVGLMGISTYFLCGNNENVDIESHEEGIETPHHDENKQKNTQKNTGSSIIEDLVSLITPQKKSKKKEDVGKETFYELFAQKFDESRETIEVISVPIREYEKKKQGEMIKIKYEMEILRTKMSKKNDEVKKQHGLVCSFCCGSGMVGAVVGWSVANKIPVSIAQDIDVVKQHWELFSYGLMGVGLIGLSSYILWNNQPEKDTEVDREEIDA